MEFYQQLLFTGIFSILLAYLLGKLFSFDDDGDDREQTTIAADERGNDYLCSDQVLSAKVRSDHEMKLKEGRGLEAGDEVGIERVGDRVGVSGAREVRVEEEEEAITVEKIACFLFDDGLERGRVGELDELEENEVELEREVDVVGIPTETEAERGDDDVAGLRDEEIALKEGCEENESKNGDEEQLVLSEKEREHEEDVVGLRNEGSENENDEKERLELISKEESEYAEDVAGLKSINEGTDEKEQSVLSKSENEYANKGTEGSESKNVEGQFVLSEEESEYVEDSARPIINEGAEGSENENDKKGRSVLIEEENECVDNVARLAYEGTEGNKNENDEKGKSLLGEEDEWEGIERSDQGKHFHEAAAYVGREGGEFALSSLGDDEQMQLYGLHKVATEGPCYEPQPMALKVSARAKWYGYLILIW